jgi:hypothetical protein
MRSLRTLVSMQLSAVSVGDQQNVSERKVEQLRCGVSPGSRPVSKVAIWGNYWILRGKPLFDISGGPTFALI